MYSESRVNGDKGVVNGEEHPNLGSLMHSEEHKNGDLLRNIDIQSFDAGNNLEGPISKEKKCTSTIVRLENHDGSNCENIQLGNKTVGDDRLASADDDSDGSENMVDNRGRSFISNAETDPLIWTPPEPEDMEDDMECSVAYDDDDDEYTDGTKWGQPSSLTSFDEEHESTHSYKEERQKAMVEAMNGQFKFLVSRFLTSEGIAFSSGEVGDNWLDIVASLSWEAAMLVKPDANEGRAMDPCSYVKVKCIACGSRSQSQVIKGLVFKKNAAHKHMPTKYRNPRLLLLQGVLGQRVGGLSSFDSMEQEKDYLKSIIEMIEACQPNVVLVEKTVSRDAQESLLAKGVTLVFDMKHTRLERIARCTGSPIISSTDIPMIPNLKHCDSFHIEKFVEEHNNSSDGGKKPSKTLMFLEGFPKPLGCTILLKGAHSDELKRLKRVVHYTVFAAYHLILETSFFADQRAIFSDIRNVEGNISCKDKQVSSVSPDAANNSNLSCLGMSTGIIPDGTSADYICDESVEKSSHGRIKLKNSDLGTDGGIPVLHGNDLIIGDLSHYESSSDKFLPSEESHDSSATPLHPGPLLSSFSTTLRKILGENLPLGTSASYESISSYSSFKEKETDSQSSCVIPVSQSLESLDCDRELKDKLDQMKSQDGCVNGKAEPMSEFSESLEHYSTDTGSNIQPPHKDDIENVLDPQSILVLLSSQCTSKKIVCEQCHLSRIKYYGSFDVPLGRFLQDILLNQKHGCSSCGEPPLAHVYCYTHQNGQLTVQVRRLPSEHHLSGEMEGKIWMWTRCLKCERESGIPRPTQRVVMSSAARGLSFGKFLELSFSSHSAARRLSRCGHLLHRDCLRFFGLGSMVAMFRYSSVEIYAACKPPPVLEFNSPNQQEWLKKEVKDVLKKCSQFFSEVGNFLRKIKPQISCLLSRRPLIFPEPIKAFSEVEEMLRQEKIEFEASLLKVVCDNEQMDETAPEYISPSFFKKELLLELYLWDRRLHSLMSCIRDDDVTYDLNQGKQFQLNNIDSSCDRVCEEDAAHEGDKIVETPMQVDSVNIEETSADIYHARDDSNIGTKQEINVAETSGNSNSVVDDSVDVEIVESPEMGNLIAGNDDVGSSTDEGIASVLNLGPSTIFPDLSSTSDKDCQENCLPVSDPTQADRDVQVSSEVLGINKSLSVKTDEPSFSEEPTKSLTNQHSSNSVSQGSFKSNSEGPESWLWSPLSELRKAYRKDLHGGYSQKFEFIHSFTPTYLSAMHQIITPDSDWLHFPVGTDGNVISVCEDEISSIIACALALSGDQYGSSENIIEKDPGKDKGGEADKPMENMHTLTSNGSMSSSHWSSTGSFDFEGVRSSQGSSSVSSDELSTSGYESSHFVDHLLSSGNVHPEIHLGVGKAGGKSKYSVVCIDAKQFYALRRRCFPSELSYISSISRCKKWDAQGGKSKALFAKTLDDRFIVKQIKKTELDSFLKFAPDYFKHIYQSLSSGSQTCLAKILGIYQVRLNKNGKEVKIDVMVMENLLYGHNICRIYDLKGAVFSRYVSDSNDPETVLLDENFVEDMRLSPIYVGGKTKHLLQRAIWNDTSFLTSINVMDYSLLVGVDKQRRELVFGIIDYLRQYTWDKQLETWVKASLVVPKNSSPTVISPKEYKKRFRKFMSKYFMTVPDSWCPERCSGPCKFCASGSIDSPL